MRHNRTQAEIGESFGVSQPTVSRAISAITPLIPEAVREFVPTADDLDPDATLAACQGVDQPATRNPPDRHLTTNHRSSLMSHPV